MAGMWELHNRPNSRTLSARDGHWRTFRHSITVTDYTIHVSRKLSKTIKIGVPARPAQRPRGSWFAAAMMTRSPALPITGFTRKILKADGII